MSRTAFYLILGLVSLIVVASMLPNQFYEAKERYFIWATIATCGIMLIVLVWFFATM
ncbi:MAG: hypothetical protein ACK4QL_08780 [Pseudanabaenaceae cyanobacterium]